MRSLIRNLATLLLDLLPCRVTGHRWHYGSFAYYETTRHCPRCKQVQLPVDDALFMHQIESIIAHERRTYGPGCHPQLEVYGPHSRTPKPPT